MTIQNFVLILAAIVVGGGLSLQGPINTQLSGFLGHPMWAAIVSFIVGISIVLIFVMVLRLPVPPIKKLLEMPYFLWFGGFLGSLFVISTILLLPVIGAVPFYSSVVLGQFMVAVLVDHFGIMSMPIHRISILRVVGLLLMIFGLFVVKKY